MDFKRKTVRNSSSTDSNVSLSPKRVAIIAGAITAFVIAGILALFIGSYIDRNEVVLKDDVVIYDESSSPFAILSSDSGSVTVSTLDGIIDGGILASGVTQATPDGLLRRLGDVQKVDGGYRITALPAPLTDAIEKCTIHATISMLDDGTYAVDQNGPNVKSPMIEQAYAYEIYGDTLFDEEGAFYTASCSNSIDVDIKVRNGSDICFSLVDHFNLGASLKNPEFSTQQNLFSKDFKPVTFSVGPLPVVLCPSLGVDIAADGSLKNVVFDTSVSIDKYVGIEYSTKEGLLLVNEDDSQMPDFDFGTDATIFKARLDASITSTLECLLYGMAGASISAGLDSDTDAVLQVVPDGEKTDGAITIPGVDAKLRGRLNEKVTLPISGNLVLQIPDVVSFFNPFDSELNFIELVNTELFNTGDMITLLDEQLRFGYAIDTYEVNIGNGYEGFAFDYPDNWEPGELQINLPVNMNMASGSARRGGVELSCGDSSVDLSFFYLWGGNYNGKGLQGYGRAQSSYTEVASTNLVPRASEAGGAEPIVVADVLLQAWESPGDTGTPSYTEDYYALVPKSKCGQTEENSLIIINNSHCPTFGYGTWPTTQDGYNPEMQIAFFTSPLSSMTEEERQQALNILASFRSIEVASVQPETVQKPEAAQQPNASGELTQTCVIPALSGYLDNPSDTHNMPALVLNYPETWILKGPTGESSGSCPHMEATIEGPSIKNNPSSKVTIHIESAVYDGGGVIASLNDVEKLASSEMGESWLVGYTPQGSNKGICALYNSGNGHVHAGYSPGEFITARIEINSDDRIDHALLNEPEVQTAIRILSSIRTK